MITPHYFPLFGLREGVVSPDFVPVQRSYRLHRGKGVGHRFVSTVELRVGDAEVSEDSNANP